MSHEKEIHFLTIETCHVSIPSVYRWWTVQHVVGGGASRSVVEGSRWSGLSVWLVIVVTAPQRVDVKVMFKPFVG